MENQTTESTTAPVLLETACLGEHTVTLQRLADGSYYLDWKRNIGNRGRSDGFQFDGTYAGLREMYERETCALRFFIPGGIKSFNWFWKRFEKFVPASTVPVYDTEAIACEFERELEREFKPLLNDRYLKQVIDALKRHGLGRPETVTMSREGGYLQYVAKPMIEEATDLANNPEVRNIQLDYTGRIYVVVNPPVYLADGRGIREIFWEKSDQPWGR